MALRGKKELIIYNDRAYKSKVELCEDLGIHIELLRKAEKYYTRKNLTRYYQVLTPTYIVQVLMKYYNILGFKPQETFTGEPRLHTLGKGYIQGIEDVVTELGFNSKQGFIDLRAHYKNNHPQYSYTITKRELIAYALKVFPNNVYYDTRNDRVAYSTTKFHLPPWYEKFNKEYHRTVGVMMDLDKHTIVLRGTHEYQNSMLRILDGKLHRQQG